ncbi:MAG: hypothetical protein MR361_07315 [Clostridiales bacterium]|nr:hypothetical protein [Clostridiales bacterium]
MLVIEEILILYGLGCIFEGNISTKVRIKICVGTEKYDNYEDLYVVTIKHYVFIENMKVNKYYDVKYVEVMFEFMTCIVYCKTFGSENKIFKIV